MMYAVLFSAMVALTSFAMPHAASGEQTNPGVAAGQILEASGIRGGLVVHLGCGDGRLTAALRRGPAYVVHGLDAHADQIVAARTHVHSLGLYGSVSVDLWKGPSLPYADNLVNLLVVSSDCRVDRDEILRVLVPNGVAWFADAKSPIGNSKLVKPRPEGLDEWTHFLHDASNNAVAHDTVAGSPQRLQWLAEPDGARHHDVLATISAVVLSGGRIFIIEDEGPTASVLLPARWWLVARDAFNGLLLWKQPIGKWESYLRKFRSGPTHLPRRLVADGPRVYVTLGYDAPVTAHDAATGQVVKTYAGTEGADEIVLCEGVLYIVRHEGERSALWAIRADSGAAIWKKQGAEMADIATQTLAVGRQLYAQIGKDIVSWDRATGKQQWRVARVQGGKSGKVRKDSGIGDGSRTPTLVAWQDVVLSADASELIALDADDGRQLWTAPTGYGYQSPIDVLVADGLVWTGMGMGKVEKVAGHEPRSGAVKKELDTGDIYRHPGMAHHRCYRNKATDRFLVLGRAGVELLDLTSGDTEQNNWIRGVCQYGVVPCNGMVYVPPHACGCYLQAKLNGFYALAPEQKSEGRKQKVDQSSRLVKGPAYPPASNPQSPVPNPSEWPTYRHDAARSGSTAAQVPTTLKPAWQTPLGGKPSAPVMAEGKVFVAVPDTHGVCALGAADGKLAWQFTAGGRVDSPPTIDRGLALFGSADGHVYCLRASDGALAWQWRAAPEDRRAIVHEQLESVWPVHGSVLVRERQVWFTAGRSTFLDGGIRLTRLDAATGKMLGETVLDSRDPQTGKQPPIGTPSLVDATLADVLSSDGSSVFMRHNAFDADGKPAAKASHLFSPLGFLDDSWWHRGYFTWGSDFSTGFTGYGTWPGSGNRAPSGQILACSDKMVYGFSRRKYGNQWPVNYDGENVTEGREYLLFAAAKDAKPAPRQPMAGQSKPIVGRKGRGKEGNLLPDTALPYTWSRSVPLKVLALVLAGDVLFAAGPPDLGSSDEDPLGAWEGKQGGLLAAFSAKDGTPLGQWKLDALPVWDGLAAADGRLLFSTADGTVRCFAPPDDPSGM